MYKFCESLVIGDDTFYLNKKDSYFCNEEHINNQTEISKAICNLFKYDFSDSTFIPLKNKVLLENKGVGKKEQICTLDLNIYENILNSIKLGCNLNLLEKISQYGRFSVSIKNQSFSIRVSIHPAVQGEILTLRLIAANKFDLYSSYSSFIKKGLTIIYGKPCSGKTTFAYYLITKNQQLRIGSIEDPVEYQIDGIIQSEGCYKNNIKSLLRHNLDLIFIGEIRDLDSAKAVQLSVLTGTTTITTIHGYNIEDVFNRFSEYGINLKDLYPSFIHMKDMVPIYENI